MAHINDRGYAMLRVPKANYLAVVTPSGSGAKSHRKVIATTDNFADLQPETKTDEGYAHGHDFPTDQHTLSWDAPIQNSIEVSAEEIGRWLLLAFGSVTTAQPDATNAPNTYKHTFVPQNAATSRQLPVTDWVEKISSIHDYLFPDAVLEKLNFKCTGKGRIMADFNLRPSGKAITPSNVNFGPSGTVHVSVPSGLHFFTNSQSVLEADDGSSPIDYQCRYEEYNFGVENEVLSEDSYRPGCPQFQDDADPSSGMTRGELLFGKRMYPSSFIVRLASGSAEREALKNRTPLNITHELVGDPIEDVFNYSLKFIQYISKYKTAQIGKSSGGIVTIQVTPDLLYDTANSRIVAVELINTIASYTT